MFTKAFLKDMAERAVVTGFQFVFGFWGLDAIGVVNAFTLDWYSAGGVFLGGAVVSVVKSFIALPVGNSGTASFTKAVKPAE